MDCPVCGAQGTKQRGKGPRTEKAVRQFVDDEGNHHRHDPNYSHLGNYACENQHHWSVWERSPCHVAGCELAAPKQRVNVR